MSSPNISMIEVEKLIPYVNNARKHSEAQVTQIAASIKEFGFINPILIDKENVLIAGHGRLAAAHKLGLHEVPCLRVEHLTESQKKAYILADNRLAELATWDDEMLKIELQHLNELEFDTALVGFDDDYFEQLLESEGENSEKNSERPEYTMKIEAPIYTPTGEKPSEQELYDRSTTDKLLLEIDQAEVPDEVKEFLRYAAQRHIVFDYGKIANYYAHASADVQDLMERSALVIIDFNKAIEYGFVQLTKDISESMDNVNEEQLPAILSQKSPEHLDALIEACRKFWKEPIDKEILKKDTLEFIKCHKDDKEAPDKNINKQQFKKWYKSLEKGEPAYEVYSEPEYIADIWSCWVNYSRKALREICTSTSLITRSLISALNPTGTIVDAGCGIAYSTVGLKQALPSARVVGTNFPDSWQYKLAQELGTQYSFEMRADPFSVGKVEMFVASEYFEHITTPLEHLREIISKCNPNWFLIANGFNSKSIGHFDFYEDNGKRYSAAEMSKLFLKEMRKHGYEKQESKIWNNRPSIWKKR